MKKQDVLRDLRAGRGSAIVITVASGRRYRIPANDNWLPGVALLIGQRGFPVYVPYADIVEIRVVTRAHRRKAQ